MTTISRLARQFNLSCSTLLYYDRIGLLRPSGRSPSNYRLYTEADRQRLAAICRYREIGLSLKTIGRILAPPGKASAPRLSNAWGVSKTRSRPCTASNASSAAFWASPPADMAEGLTREKWTTLLRASGMTDTDMLQWHVEFERLFPDDHRLFLESLA